MATVGGFYDAPNQLRIVGENVKLRFEKLGEGRARVSWNIPLPPDGCSSDNSPYNGIIIVIDNKSTHPFIRPEKERVYVADPTANRELHCGDDINGALVIGALYDDITTTEILIDGISDNTAYYVSGYVVDKQLRYHEEGAHAYSLDHLLRHDIDHFPAYHEVLFREILSGDDASGLIDNETYSFVFGLSGTEYTITIDGINALTINELIAAINYELSLLESPYQGDNPPNSGSLYYSKKTRELREWDGFQYILLPVINEPSDPSELEIGSMWVDSSDSLYYWNGIAWESRPYFNTPNDISLLEGGEYWRFGDRLFVWNGNLWVEETLYLSQTNPESPTFPMLGTYWFDEEVDILSRWDGSLWQPSSALNYFEDPNVLSYDTYWYDGEEVRSWNGTDWLPTNVVIDREPNKIPIQGSLWLNSETLELFIYHTDWEEIPILVYYSQNAPHLRNEGDVWWDSENDVLFVWDKVFSAWKQVQHFIIGGDDPVTQPTIEQGSIWFDGENYLIMDGCGWEELEADVLIYNELPREPTAGDYWYSGEDWYMWTGEWVLFDPVNSSSDPSAFAAGTFWFDTTNSILKQWNGVNWVNVLTSFNDVMPKKGTQWYDTDNNILKAFNGTTWNEIAPIARAYIKDNKLILESRGLGSSYNLIISNFDLFKSMRNFKRLEPSVKGVDGVSKVPTYEELGVGKDGSSDERRELVNSLRAQFGYPVVNVELTNEQFDTAISLALESIRKRSGVAYKRALFFLDIKPSVQHYLLTDREVGFNKIVTVMRIYRTNSAFLSAAHASGAYGQAMIQQLYNMGQFDILSYHMVSSYIDELEKMFAARIMFKWDETTRRLSLYQSVNRNERVLVDCSIERTENELLSDRWTKNWIEKYAKAECMMMLYHIRGKFSTLPGAGGGVSLNASDLLQQSIELKEACYQQIDDRLLDNPEEFGADVDIVIG